MWRLPVKGQPHAGPILEAIDKCLREEFSWCHLPVKSLHCCLPSTESTPPTRTLATGSRLTFSPALWNLPPFNCGERVKTREPQLLHPCCLDLPSPAPMGHPLSPASTTLSPVGALIVGAHEKTVVTILHHQVWGGLSRPTDNPKLS